MRRQEGIPVVVAMDQQQWTEVVAAAVRAPSIHNTQPWAFTARPDRLELRLDRERALPVLDPTGRQQVISCGAALEFALVALAVAGRAGEVDLAPDPGEPGLLATVRIAGERQPTDDDRALRAAIDRRHTVRAAFEPRPVPPELTDRWAGELGPLGVWVKPVTREDEEVATAVLLSRAEEIERGDPAYLAELERWLRSDPQARDGVPRDAVPGEDPATRPSNWLVRDFVAAEHPARTFLPAEDPAAPPQEVERPAVLLLGTAEDDRAAWLRSGQALGRLLLRATAEGIAASPLTQALDQPSTRVRLRSRLSLVGHPQMLLRMGYHAASAAEPVSGRRPVAEVLRLEQA